jgi:hypothetical protein
MVPAFKKPNGCNLPREHENFNTCLSSARVISEHTIGIWKARFPWLRNIRMRLTEDPESMRCILQVLECTVILHNFLIQENEDDVPDDWLNDTDTFHLDPTDELNRDIPEEAPKNSRQMMLMTLINDNRY